MAVDPAERLGKGAWIDNAHQRPSAPPLPYQPSLNERAKMVRRHGTLESHGCDQFADAALAVAHEIEHSASRGVGNRAKHTFGVSWSAHAGIVPALLV
jgi:hypothetical protein